MKKNLCIAFSCLIVFILCLLLSTQIIKLPVDFSKLNDKYQYVYKIMATKPIYSEACLIAELVGDSDDVYCSFKVTEVIFGECEDDVIKVRLPKREAINSSHETYQESGNGFRYGYYHFLTTVDTREKIICDFKVGEKYLLCLANGNKSGNDITYEAVCFLGKDNYPLSESDIENPENLVLMKDYLKFASEKIGYNCSGKYQPDEVDRVLRKYFGFSIYEMFER
ncbi:MAG: hypothetical protein E7564_07490 [Ruminococcaceae bacterium]|nr:hypothetical protein [Oscillospiraceae bacterium]